MASVLKILFLLAFSTQSVFVRAQNSSVCNQASLTITTDGDAARIRSCGIFNGNIIIASSATGIVNLDGLQQITGSLVCHHAEDVTAINADALTSIGDTFDLLNLTALSRLNFPGLHTVGSVEWVSLRSLTQFGFPASLQDARRIDISDTALQSFTGVNLTTTASININNNRFLNSLDFYSLEVISEVSTFFANGSQLAVNLPNLRTADSLTFLDIDTLNIPTLANLNGSLTISSNRTTSISAPSLVTIKQYLDVTDSAQLQTLNFPLLEEIGESLIVKNNFRLNAVDGFGALKTVSFNLYLSGVFNSIGFNALQRVQEVAYVDTTSTNKTICDIIYNLEKTMVIRKYATCMLNGTFVSSDESSSAHASHISPAVLGVIIAVGVVIIILLSYFCCCHRHRSRSRWGARAKTVCRLPMPQTEVSRPGICEVEPSPAYVIEPEAHPEARAKASTPPPKYTSAAVQAIASADRI